MAGREVLLAELEELLGFDDGSEDVLDHLLTIDSKEDLYDYLKQLLGLDFNAVEKFVEDVGRFQNGEVLTAPQRPPSTNSKPLTAHEKPPALIAEPKTKLQPLRNTKKPAPSKAPPAQPKQVHTKPTATTVPPRKQMTAQKQKLKATANEFKPPTETPVKQDAKSTSSQKSLPSRGKATFECGCFGNKHKALANCLYCGRIACEKEGYNYCPFCGFLVEKIQPPTGATTDEAWLHKERLLRYDRESVQRTVILDDQEDFYNQSHSHWLTDEERAHASAQEEERLDSHKRKPMKLDIAM